MSNVINHYFIYSGIINSKCMCVTADSVQTWVCSSAYIEIVQKQIIF